MKKFGIIGMIISLCAFNFDRDIQSITHKVTNEPNGGLTGITDDDLFNDDGFESLL